MTTNRTPCVTQELLPCPFCGGEAHVYEWDDLGLEPSEPSSFHVACTVCEGGHPPSYNRAEAITAWNTRQSAEAASSEREAILLSYRQALIDLCAEVYAGEGSAAFLRAMEIFSEESDEIIALATRTATDAEGGA